ncbi:UvrD-helicase domain-containing protein [Maribacter sp. 2308TA10-17]|uniref:UvrD-helicase domain-containing protein n=1 Tax=Maribacter sp. 2308TA10-17 TaxID=3386276 RepID=UPI0039BD8429
MLKNSFKIYNASAGSGKTYMLAKEYLKIILSSEGYRQILALTFTNKAVNEMKERILKSLFDFSKTIALDDASSLFKDLLLELKIEAPELQKKSKIVLKKILHNYAFFDISTIDKFTHRLIRTFAKDLKIPQNFEVILDTDLLLDEAVSRLINKAGSDSKLTKILIDFALEKIDEDKSWDIALDLKQVGKLLFNETDARHLKNFETKKIDDFLVLQNTIQSKIKFLKKEMMNTASRALELIDENDLDHSDFKSSYFPKFMLKIQRGDLKIDFKPAWKQNFGAEPLYATKCQEAKKIKLDSLQTQFVSLFETIKNHWSSYLLAKNIYQNIVPLTVLNAIQQEVKKIQAEKDQLSISEFNTIISNEIKDQPAPFIYERLGEKYRHYFIDEFQDTSEMQWNNLIPLVDNALSSEIGSLFLVGDAKQAIYRWRGGKAEQFLNLAGEVLNPFVVKPDIKLLPSNYRSHEEIIRFNNDFFTRISPFFNNKIYETLYNEGNKQECNSLKNGLVQLSFITDKDEATIHEQYGNEVLNKIVSVIEKNYTYKDICILVRGNKEGVLLANFLAQESIPVLSSESLLLVSSAKVRFLVNLLRYQNQPQDEEIVFELLSFLSKDEQERHRFIGSHLQKIELLFQTVYDFDLLSLQKVSVYDGLEYAIKKFNLAPEGDAYLNFLMDTVLDVEQKEGTGISVFLSHWDKKKEKLSISAPSGIDAVQIMTVHKSKGLEFEIVIFPYANSQIYKEKDAKLWLPVDPNVFEGFDEVLINKKQEVVQYNELAEHLFEEENTRLELDAFNVLYVALTRAIKALYVITKIEVKPKPINDPKRYSDLFVSYLKGKGIWEESKNIYCFGTLDHSSGDKKSEEQETISYQYSYKEREGFKILTKSGALWDTERERALSKGNLIHHIMGLVETEKDVENALNFILRNGSITIEELDLMRKTVLHIINHPKLQQYYEEGSNIKNEKDIITKNGSILRPDRVVIKEKGATVIDYKTGSRDIRYKDQIDSYADALHEMGYAIENKIIIYINEEITPEFI